MSNVLPRLSVPHCRGGVKVSFSLLGIYRLYNRFGSAVYVSQRGMCRRSVLYAIKQTLTTLKPHRFEAFIHNIVTFSLRYNNQDDGLSFTPLCVKTDVSSSRHSRFLCSVWAIFANANCAKKASLRPKTTIIQQKTTQCLRPAYAQLVKIILKSINNTKQKSMIPPQRNSSSPI